MTESAWLSCRDPQPMLLDLPRPPTERKLRLLGCGCCRAVWDLFTDDRSRAAVEVVERFADGDATETEMWAAYRESSVARDLAVGPDSTASRRHRSLAGRCTSWAAHVLTNVSPHPNPVPVVQDDLIEALAQLQHAQWGRFRSVRASQVELVREVFGNPFRPVVFNPAWRTDTVLALASQMYGSRQFGAMPILADALQDAGCENEAILAPCRQPSAHARGCWVADELLGRE